MNPKEMYVPHYQVMHAPAQLAEFVSVKTQTEAEHKRESMKEKLLSLRSRYFGFNVKEVPYGSIADVMHKIIASNYGMHKIELFKETAMFGFGWERLGPVIKNTFDRVFLGLLRQKKIKEDSDGKIDLVK